MNHYAFLLEYASAFVFEKRFAFSMLCEVIRTQAHSQHFYKGGGTRWWSEARSAGAPRGV